MQKRKDSKGRRLKEGEIQRKDGRYEYRYTDLLGRRQCEYSWRLVVTDPYPAGKRKDISLREKEELVQGAMAQGIGLHSQMTLNQLVDRYLLLRNNLKNSTYMLYLTIYNSNVRKEEIGEWLVSDIQKSNILALYRQMSEQDLSNGTIHRLHSILYSGFELAMEEGLISKNPTIKCLNDYPYDPVGRRCALSEEETEVYLQFLERDKVYGAYIDIVRLILGTGLRRGEVLALTWQNVDLKKTQNRGGSSVNTPFPGIPQPNLQIRTLFFSRSVLFILFNLWYDKI